MLQKEKKTNRSRHTTQNLKPRTCFFRNKSIPLDKGETNSIGISTYKKTFLLNRRQVFINGLDTRSLRNRSYTPQGNPKNFLRPKITKHKTAIPTKNELGRTMPLQERRSHTDSHDYQDFVGVRSNRWFSEKLQLVGVWATEMGLHRNSVGNHRRDRSSENLSVLFVGKDRDCFDGIWRHKLVGPYLEIGRYSSSEIGR